ncbi:MAG: cation diffusion facilitator family transporter [Deltaproteobacteria bacterium]|nr:cation diffusion facilitator family transporter [Deltaproteobacteria bacterium]
MSNTTVPTIDGERRLLIREKIRAALASVLAGGFLTTIKLIAGLATGSLGLLAEAAHSALDFGAAAVTLFAVRSSWRPPDAEHQYGHGKIENLSALVESLLLAATSVWILYEAGKRFMGQGPEVEPSGYAFAVMGASIVIDLVRSRDLARVARMSNSQALEADALHFSTDIASSAVVIVGLVGVVVARTSGVAWLTLADPIAASIVALIVLVLSWNLGRRAADMLLDRAPAGKLDAIRAALAGLPGVAGAPELRLRQAGDQYFAEVEVGMQRNLPVAEGERLAAEVRRRIGEVLGGAAHITVQLNAEVEGSLSLHDRIAIAVASEGIQAHDITARRDGPAGHADLHIELPRRMALGEGHAIADRIERRVRRDVPELSRVDIHLELAQDEAEVSGEIDAGTRAALASKVEAVSRRVVGDAAVHDLMFARTATGIYLSCHCFLAAETPMDEAHAITDRLEAALRAAVPELTRVAVHAEPRSLGA